MPVIHDIDIGICPLLGTSLFVWLQGCPRHCPGCFNQEARDLNQPGVFVIPEDIARLCLEVGGGLVLSGGEPFLQAPEVAKITGLIRADHPDTPILCYTGYTIEEILAKREPGWINLLAAIDVLIDGPFLKDRLTDSPLAGSSNQRILALSNRIDFSRGIKNPGNGFQAKMTEDGVLTLLGTGHGGLDMNCFLDRIGCYGIMLEDEK